MRICYSGKSAISARKMADEDDDVEIVRCGEGDINWGRAWANTRLNPDISLATNKRLMRERFRDNDVPMPQLVEAGEVEQRLCDPERVDEDFVGRPDRHTKGRGVWMVTTLADLDRALRGTRRKAAATHFMEWIDAPREYRVHIFRGRSIRISEKAYIDPARKKLGYTTAKPQHEVDHVRQAAKQAVAAVGLDFGAVDVLADDEECWVLEVNSAPGIGGSLPRLYVAKFKEFLEDE